MIDEQTQDDDEEAEDDEEEEEEEEEEQNYYRNDFLKDYGYWFFAMQLIFFSDKT